MKISRPIWSPYAQTPSLNNQTNELYGGDGNDSITGGHWSSEYIEGGAGDDTIRAGSYGGDTIIGGAGDDSMTASQSNGSNNTYIINRNEGNDTISDSENSVLEFGDNIILSELEFTRDNTSLVINIDDSSIRLSNLYSRTNYGSQLNKLKFSNLSEYDIPLDLENIGDSANNELDAAWEISDTVHGGAGDDTLNASGKGADSLYGDVGNDVLYGGNNSYLNGGAGDDTIHSAAPGVNYLNTFEFGMNEGNDRIFNADENDILKLGAGITADNIELTRTRNEQNTSGDHLLISFDNNSTTIELYNYFRTYNRSYGVLEQLTLSDGSTFDINGEQFANIGTSSDDNLLSVYYRADTIYGNAGDDTIKGNGSSLTEGNSEFYGGAGNDSIESNGAGGTHLLDGGEGNDTIKSIATSGDVTINGGDGDDNLYHKSGSIISGSLEIYGDGGADFIKDLHTGNHVTPITMSGGSGDDTIISANGHDVIIGGTGNDSLTGGSGSDLFIMSLDPNSSDIITDFANGTDIIDLTALTFIFSMDDLAISSSGSDLVITLTNPTDNISQTIILNNVNSVTASDFVFYELPNLAPTDIAIDNLTVDENADGDVIGTVTITDPNTDDTHILSVDDNRFEIVNGALQLKAGNILDFETEASITINITATDADGLSLTKEFTINVNDDSSDDSTGDDNIILSSGDDSVDAGTGDDTVDAGDGNDTIDGGAGNDFISTGSGNDNISGGEGDDIIAIAGLELSNGDTISGGSGHDQLRITGSTITGGDLDNITGIDEIYFANDHIHEITLTDSFVDNSDNDQVTIDFSGAISPENGATLDATAVTSGRNIKAIGGAGGDTFKLGGGNDTITGGSGADSFVITAATNKSDVITDFALASDRIDLTGFIIFETLSDLIITQNGADTIINLGDGQTILLQNIDSILLNDTHFVGIIADVDSEDPIAPTGAGVTEGTNTADAIAGTSGDDIISALDGSDTVWGNGGNDIIYGSAGLDTLWGGGGNDTIYGSTGDDLIGGDGNDDLLFGADGSDTIWGGSGLDTIFGGTGDDLIGGDGGADSLMGADGNDTIYGGGDNDTLDGGYGDDLIGGDNGDDDIDAGAGNDQIYGGGGADTILGGDGNDSISGDGNADIINGGAGADILYGNDGNDNFVFSNIAHSTNLATDVIADFSQGNDVITLTGLGFTAITASAASGTTLGFANDGTNTTIIDASGSFVIQLNGVYALTSTDFVL